MNWFKRILSKTKKGIISEDKNPEEININSYSIKQSELKSNRTIYTQPCNKSEVKSTPNPQERQIRVFISSTFRDMQAERDHLVKFVFPQLRKLCESRGVIWGEVDLRCGITDEQRSEGKVLPICLEEIKRCRPYFIGVLDERYGWIPDEINPDVIEQEPWLNQHLHGKTSVAELEIIPGVLREESMHGYAFFYFRNPKYIETLTRLIYTMVGEN